jgi:hypothetical protein
MALCSLSDARLTLPQMGVEVRAYSVTMDRDIGRLDHAQVEVSREAGELIGASLWKHHPAEIHFGGKLLGRFCLEPDGVELSREKGIVKLRDPKVVLDAGIIEGTYERTTLGEVVRDIFDSRDDPHEVLTGLLFTNVETTGVSESLESQYSTLLDSWKTAAAIASPTTALGRFIGEQLDLGWIDTVNEIETDAIVAVTREIDALQGIDREDGGFEFDGDSPYTALQEVQAEYGVQSWVDDRGVLNIGFPEAVSRPFLASHLDGALKISDYNVTENASPVTGVVGYGRYKGFPDVYTGKTLLGTEAIQMRVEARWKGADEGRLLTQKPMKTDTPLVLAKSIERTLRMHIYDNTAGEVRLNPLASDDNFGSPFDLTVGDQLFVVGRSQNGDCRREIPTTIFGVHGVRHRITSEGWEMGVRVGHIVGPDAIELSVFVIDENTNRWVDASAYYSARFGRNVDYTEILTANE